MNVNRDWEFLSLLEPYYKDLDNEEEFKRINESQIMPSYEEYQSIEMSISIENMIKFNEFLRIYKIFWEVEKFDDFTLETAKKVLNLLNYSLFKESKFFSKKPKYSTYSLIEKMKINIAYQMSKSTTIEEITDWLLIAEEIRNGWKEIDMKSLLKSGCNFFMKNNGAKEITDPKILILLNKFIGRDKEYRKQIGIDALNWLKAHYDEDLWKCKAILSALSSNHFKFHSDDKQKLNEIENKVGYWKFGAKRKIKIYRRWINAFINTGKQSKRLKIIQQSEISEKSPIPVTSTKASLFRCKYKNIDAVIKEYQLEQLPKNKIKNISYEIANSMYLSKNNKTQIFLHYYGLYFEKNESEFRIGIVMESCTDSLENYIYNGGNVDLNEIIDSLLNGYFLLHNLGLAHNDIKPENIFIKIIGDKIQPKIADYDISSAFSLISGASLHKTVTAVRGTIAFMAPEVQDSLLKDKLVMKINQMRADVFSLGIVILWLKRKKWPPEGKLDREDYIEKGMKKVKTPWLKKLLDWMLPSDPEERKKFGEIIKLKKTLKD